MATSIRPYYPGATMHVVYEGKTPIGRMYRVVAEGADMLHFQRSFDSAPDTWHTEGIIWHPVDDWRWALGQHIIGGDALTYATEVTNDRTTKGTEEASCDAGR